MWIRDIYLLYWLWEMNRTGKLQREPRDISGREGLGIRETGATGEMRVSTRPWCVSLAHSLSSFTFMILPTSLPPSAFLRQTEITHMYM
ncbi:hypothetical protein QR685DRAFT_306435 [Neurospora intermedia]|uniref:Uncharacterized protein n=1 Tax=Neurospora intermedia TaxID=5142 RepID=A0ABR3DBC0_NEUIN